MSSVRLIVAGLRYHWKTHGAVALSVAVATAVITGALLIGHSVRASLRALIIERLASIDHAIVTDRFFDQQLARRVASIEGFDRFFAEARPAIVLEGTVEFHAAASSGPRRAAATVLGCGRWFWQWDPHGPEPLRKSWRDGVWVNATLADELSVRAGDEVLVRLPPVSVIPGESTLGRKSTTAIARRLPVAGVVPPGGLGRFSLRADQKTPRNIFVPIKTLQTMLDQRDQANAVFIAGKFVDQPAPVAASRLLREGLRPRLVDYGLSLRRVTGRFQQETVWDYFNLTCNQMILPDAVRDATRRAWASHHPQEVFTYLANEIAADTARVAYSTVTGIDPHPRLGPWTPDAGQAEPLGRREIVVNQWVADDFREQGVKLKPGDPIRMTYFAPDDVRGEVREDEVTWQLQATIPLIGSEGRRLRAADPHLTPDVPGVTDKLTMGSWDPPFPFDASRVRTTLPHAQDEEYWRQFRATPKAFVSLDAARQLWAGRFGNTTSIRVPAEGVFRSSLAQALLTEIDPADMGIVFRPLKRRGLESAAGTTPFEILFLSFSMFLIAAAAMLTALVFALGLDWRSREVGVLLALGLTRKHVRALYLVEGCVIAGIGATVGCAGGIAYARAMLAALQSPRLWLQAISATVLHLDVRPRPLVVGAVVALALAIVVIAWTLRRLRRASPRSLLAGRSETMAARGPRRRRGWATRMVAAAGLAGAGLIAWAGTRLGGEAQAAAFFGCGALALVSLLVFVRSALVCQSTGADWVSRPGVLSRMAVRTIARYPGRSTLTIGLVASASFLIVAVSAFRLAPLVEGTGGFALYAESQLPIFHDLGTRDGREELGFPGDALHELDAVHVFPLRVFGGGDASCLNLYQSRQPRVLGMPRDFIDRGGFRWAATAATTPAQQRNPWRLLASDAEPGHGPIPVVLDKNTAYYSLHLTGVGSRWTIADARGDPVVLEVVGLLDSSLLQGDVLMSEAALLRVNPDTEGYRAFLIETPPGQAGRVSDLLEDRLGDLGFDAVSARARLAAFLQVQNTYLSTFQSLGGLGLVLGTLGLAAVQLRDIVERRGELAVMRAAGFRASRIMHMIMWENSLLLAGGLGLGVIAALAAVFPHLVSGGASIPWTSLAAMLGLIVAVGTIAGWVATRRMIRRPLLPALRGD